MTRYEDVRAMPVFSGGLLGAADAFQATVEGRVTSYGTTRVAEQQHAHVELGAARARADVAVRLVRDLVTGIQALHARDVLDASARVRLKGRAGLLVDHCRQAVNEMVRLGGAAGFHRDKPLQRFFRDLNVLATHAFWEWDGAREQVGRHRLGLEPTTPLV